MTTYVAFSFPFGFFRVMSLKLNYSKLEKYWLLTQMIVRIIEWKQVLWLNILKWQIIVTSILLWQEYSFSCCRWWLWWCFNCIFAFLGLNLVTHILHDTLTGSVNSCQHFLNCLHQNFWKKICSVEADVMCWNCSNQSIFLKNDIITHNLTGYNSYPEC